MSAIRKQGAINANTTLIDTGLYGISGSMAVYLINGRKKCLIDGGGRKEAGKVIKVLKQIDSFPPDMVIITHSHHDHVQGIPVLQREALKIGKIVEVLASEKAIPLLEDQSWNKVYGPGPYEGIYNVKPLKQNDVIDLGDTTLKIFEVPGHSVDQIAIMDENYKNLFVGDAIGDKIADGTFIPPFYPPSWDPDSFYASIDRLGKLEYHSICLAHFGYIYGDEAKHILDEAKETCETWWQLFEKNAEKLEDTAFMREVVLNEIKPGIPDMKIESPKLKALFALMSGWRKLTGKAYLPLGLLLLSGVLKDLMAGYKTFKEQQERIL